MPVEVSGGITLANVAGLWQPTILDAYWRSIRLSLATAIGGALIGFLLASAAVLGGLPPNVRSTLMTFSGVAANFAGVPLAFAFIATLGRAGMVTVLLNALFGVSTDGSASVDVPGSLKGVGAVLVTSEPEGGSRVPTRQPILSVTPA